MLMRKMAARPPAAPFGRSLLLLIMMRQLNMSTRVAGLIAGMLLVLGPTLTWGLSTTPSNPGFGDTVYSQAQLDAAIASAKVAGRQEAAIECIANPKNCGCAADMGINPCGVTLSAVLSSAKYGETEPNDHIVAADAMVQGVKYWGQSRDLLDWDWFYVTTQEPNQRLTISFTVPDRVIEDMTRVSQGWLVAVRDAAGNTYAQFDTRFALDDLSTINTNESKDINYPVFLGHVGTYYITVVPSIQDSCETGCGAASILYWPYNLAVVLDYSNMEGTAPDVNFHDVEIEPNNDKQHANPLASGVTMYGLMRQTENYDPNAINTGVSTGSNGASFDQTDVDYFYYDSAGNEQILLSWCGLEACKAVDDPEALIDWFVEVTDSADTPLVSFNTDKSQTIHFGLASPGRYYVKSTFHHNTDAQCVEKSTTELVCTGTSNVCQVATCTEMSDPGTCGGQGVVGNYCCTWAKGTGCSTPTASTTLGDCTTTTLETTTGAPSPAPKWCKTCEGVDYKCLRYAATTDTNALNVEYNFTWWGTKLYPWTYGTDAYDAYLERPSWYQDR